MRSVHRGIFFGRLRGEHRESLDARMERSRLMIAFKLLFSLVVCQITVVIGQVVSITRFEAWYINLQKPLLTVPTWLFLPLRSLTLFSMGIGLFFILIHTNKPQKVREVFILFMIQLALNAMLNIIFLGFHSVFGGIMFSASSLALAAIITTKSFQISEIAGIMTFPYLFGMIYTVVFDIFLFIMNR